jgi:D-3-phosphoglycerate dehydrogenase / 2-oxoglutarate reductase
MRTLRILVISPVDAQALGMLKGQHDVHVAYDAPEPHLIDAVEHVDVLVLRSGPRLTARVLEAAPRLRLVLRAGCGTDNIDMPALARHGARLVTIPEPGAKAVSEMAFALMLALSRNLLAADRQWRAGRWVKHQIVGHGLDGKVLGIVGAGNIGQRVGRLGAAWGMQVLGCVEHPTPRASQRLQEHGIQLATLDDVVSSADYLSLHVPLTDKTRGLIDAAALGRMKEGAFLVNLARGGVVDETALREALTSGRLAGAALDVHEREGNGHISPLADLDNVILTPHIGAGTADAQREIGERIVSLIEELAAEDLAATAN